MQNLKMVLRKHPLYFETDQNGDRLPHLESVAITFVPDKQSEFLLFIQGKLDMINSLDASYKDELLDKKGQSASKIRRQGQTSSFPLPQHGVYRHLFGC